MVVRVRDARDADGRKASEGRVMVERLYETPCDDQLHDLAVLGGNAYGEQTERYCANELETTHRTNHLDVILALRDVAGGVGPRAIGGSSHGVYALFNLQADVGDEGRKPRRLCSLTADEAGK